MADTKSKTGAGDRSRDATEQDYALQRFADAHDISLQQVRELAERVGHSRAALEGAVRMLKD